ncbi:hypothetical protein BDL97_02G131000 [Sphagnum fallax]|nr:hypothetical protein BDL97_02G131000 [Sphagnum fallax]KAH8971242.1 hypothetical protein BDL97_02G131000 [Sphagnum fallax]
MRTAAAGGGRRRYRSLTTLRRVRPRCLLLLFLIAICVPVIFFNYTTISYLLRPIWDSPPKPFQLHGWSLRKKPPRRVFDAVIFSNEIDLLEIRVQELMPYVTKFLVLESNTTFTGKRKALIFKNNIQRFSFVRDKLTHLFFAGQTLQRWEDPFVNEDLQRTAMDQGLLAAGIADGDLVIMADADEIPSAHTIRLLQSCDGFPPIMHLHFCFRYISDFMFKMQAYSHADRVRHSSYLNPVRIQEIICQGRDLFNMLPEAFSFKDLIAKMGSVTRSFSGVHLPMYLLKNPQKFSFLLPGNCIRETPV